MNHTAKKILRNIVTLGIVAAVIIYVCAHFVHLGNVEYTDNAQIRRNIVPVNSRVQGYVERICFDDFQQVHKGDTLVVIQDVEYRLRLAQAKSNLQKAMEENGVFETVISTTDNNLTVSDAGIEELKIRLDQARKDYERYDALYAQKAVTKQQYETFKTNYEALKAKYDMLVAQKQSTKLKKVEQTQRLEQHKSNIEVAQAALELAELNLSYTVIAAPCDGVASRKSIQLGQLIQPGQNLLSVVEDGNVWVVANYKETQTANIREGMEVEVEVDAVPDVTFKGVVSTISQATGAQYSVVPQDNATGNFVKIEQRVPVKIVFSSDNKAEDLALLRTGMNAECEVLY